ncbi:MAG: DUF1704 domain-containing protein [Candidatus Paceibacterota bacterium]
MNNKALDKEWFEIYKDGCAFDDIDYIKFDQKKLAKQKELFLAGLIDEPTLEYDIDIQSILYHKTKLLEFQEIVATDNSAHPAVKKAYQMKIKDQLNKVSLLESVVERNDKTVTETSKRIYGAPDREVMRRALSSVLYVAEKRGVTLGDKWCELVDYFDAKTDGSDIDYYKIEDNQEKLLAAEQLVEVLKKALLDRGIAWEVTTNSSVVAVTVSYRDKTIYIPETRMVTEVLAEALVNHEVGVHLARHLNGFKSSLLLLSVGLNGYLNGEEGLATYRQVQTDKSFLPGITKYVLPALMIGLHKNTPWTFRQIYDLTKEYYVLLGGSKNKLSESAWKHGIVVFRGTSGKAGNVFTRSTAYFSGYLGIKELIDKNDPEVERFLVGKYDPTNQDHIDILNQLDIR